MYVSSKDGKIDEHDGAEVIGDVLCDCFLLTVALCGAAGLGKRSSTPLGSHATMTSAPRRCQLTRRMSTAMPTCKPAMARTGMARKYPLHDGIIKIAAGATASVATAHAVMHCLSHVGSAHASAGARVANVPAVA